MKLLIDVGYTKTKMANWAEGRLSRVEAIATHNAWLESAADANQRKISFVNWLCDQISARLTEQKEIEEVGVCLPGAINKSGWVASINSLWGRASEGLGRDYFSDRMGVPVFLYNDLVAAAAFHGPDALEDITDSAVILNIGSGIGSKLYDAKRGGVILGESGLDGEIGLSVVDDRQDAPSMRDGSLRGSLGLYSSGSGFARLVREAATESPNAAKGLIALLARNGLSLELASRDDINRAAVDALHSGDAFLLELLGQSIKLLARALHVVVLFNSPKVIVVTGGFYHALESDYRHLLCKELSRRLAAFYSPDDIETMVRSGRNDGSESLLGIAHLLKTASPVIEKIPRYVP